MQLCLKYAWAIPNEEAIQTIRRYCPIIEIGAGTGYWLKLINDFKSIGFDLDPYKNDWCSGEQYYNIIKGGAEEINRYPQHTLFLCWPPYTNDLVDRCLKYYKDRILIYIGENNGGCTGWSDKLDSEWEEINTVRIPQWIGIHDYMMIYERT